MLKQYRSAAEMECAERRELLRKEHPDIYAQYIEQNRLGASLGLYALKHTAEETEKHIDQMKASAKQVVTALEDAGLPHNYLFAWYSCDKCNDTGFAGGTACECRRQIMNRLAFRALSDVSQVQECTFDNFDLGYYPKEKQKTMRNLLNACRRYADTFSQQSKNLLFVGPPGLGKTHLSLAIARTVVEQGRYVLYASAVRMLEQLVDIHFNNESDGEYKEIAYTCDLLVLDDLGTEFQTRFTKSEVYNLINTRHNEGRPTIINTNLSLEELKDAYDERGLSRLIGHYEVNRFSGKDIRIQKRYGKGGTND